MTLATAFAHTAAKNPDKTAIFWGESQYSYGLLRDQSTWLGRQLLDHFQLLPGQRVGLWMKNCPEFVSAFFAILQAGAVAVPINNFLKPEEVHCILADSGVSVLISDASMAASLAQLSAECPNLRVLQVEEIPAVLAGVPPLPRSERQESDLAILIYTSGTTGKAKGVMLSNHNMLENVESCRVTLEAVGDDRLVVLLPLFHSFMLCVGICLPMLLGGSIVLIRSLHPIKNVIQEIILRQGTILPAIPQFFRGLSHPSVPRELPLRLCISGAAPLPEEILREFNQKFSVPLLEGYGLSEASPVVSFNPLHGPWKGGSIGKPVPNVEVTIQDEQGRELPLGQTGEICVRGPNVMMGYWNQPEETAKTIRQGWLLTGDVGHGDEEGFFFITDRKKDMLLVNGINVYPRQIEEVLYKFPGVREAAVVGRHDPRRGEQPIAFVSATEGTSLDEKALAIFVRERLADYKVPRRIILLPALPRNATGKILKTDLRQLLVSQFPAC